MSPIDRNALRQAADAAHRRIQAAAPQTGVGAMLAGVHKGALAGFVTIETLALPPVPHKLDGAWTVVALLGVAAGPGGPKAGMQPPWGFVRWAADGAVLETQRFVRADPRVGAYAFAPAPQAMGAWVRGVDAVVGGQAPLQSLLPLAADVLPHELLPVLRELVGTELLGAG